MLARTFARDASHGITRARVHKSAHTTRPRSETVYARTWFVSVIGSPSAPKANHPHHASAHPTLARLSPKATTSFFSQSKFTWPLVARATVRFFILTFEVQFFITSFAPPPFFCPSLILIRFFLVHYANSRFSSTALCAFFCGFKLDWCNVHRPARNALYSDLTVVFANM